MKTASTAGLERRRLLAVELREIQEAGDAISSERRAAGVPDDKLEELMTRLARARGRVQASIERDR